MWPSTCTAPGSAGRAAAVAAWRVEVRRSHRVALAMPCRSLSSRLPTICSRNASILKWMWLGSRLPQSPGRRWGLAKRAAWADGRGATQNARPACQRRQCAAAARPLGAGRAGPVSATLARQRARRQGSPSPSAAAVCIRIAGRACPATASPELQRPAAAAAALPATSAGARSTVRTRHQAPVWAVRPAAARRHPQAGSAGLMQAPRASVRAPQRSLSPAKAAAAAGSALPAGRARGMRPMRARPRPCTRAERARLQGLRPGHGGGCGGAARARSPQPAVPRQTCGPCRRAAAGRRCRKMDPPARVPWALRRPGRAAAARPPAAAPARQSRRRPAASAARAARG